MRVTKEQAAENRERILDEAARLFREKGLRGVGVDELAEAAGLTYGSLYSQFGSKDRLVAAAMERALQSFGARLADVKSAEGYVSHYLSTEHRDNPGTGCIVAAAGSEVPRQSAGVRRVFTAAVKSRMARLVSLLPGRRGRKREDDALAMLAMMAGGMMLARAVDERALSDRILAACRSRLKEMA
jgi:TetR/AcrR family transcriptional repressor of nem operon